MNVQSKLAELLLLLEKQEKLAEEKRILIGTLAGLVKHADAIGHNSPDVKAARKTLEFYAQTTAAKE